MTAARNDVRTGRQRHPTMSESAKPAVEASSNDVAIIGMACRFPGAENPSAFWSLLRDGREAFVAYGEDDLRRAGVPESLLRDPNYVRGGMPLPKMEQFDAGFFGFSPLDARIMDPQHRHFLECTWEALEDAGYDPARHDGSIGVFAGSGHNAYLPYNLLTNPHLLSEVGLFLLRHTGNDKDFLTTRASYCFDLKGPSVNVQTACSTSLVAVHLAAQSLLNGECDLALAGGVTIELPHHQGYRYKDSEILSRDGHCRPFDAHSTGTVFGSGVGMVVLKRLDQALADGDNIHAVLKATAVNNDGAGKVSYLAPSIEGQAAAVHEALSVGGIAPESVTFIETHGTGTQIGDPIEVAALTEAYAPDSRRAPRCAIGSVKSNIGHLDTAAGVASMIKVILAMKHRQIPPTLHYQSANPSIEFDGGPFFVNAALEDWQSPGPLRAGISSLGVGGTNAHAIVQEAPRQVSAAPARALQLLLLSARSEQSLVRSRSRLAQFLEEENTEDSVLADAAYTLAVGRRHFPVRGFAVARDKADAAAVLDGNDRERFVQSTAPASSRRACFMFAGGGTQYPNMGRGLYESEPVYRQAVDDCLRLLEEFVDFDLRSLLYPQDLSAEGEAAKELERPTRSLTALFTTQYAQAKLWESWGVEPAALIGHSMGENTAACISGVLSLRDALGLVALRGRLFETVGEGSMMTVELEEQQLLPLLGSELSLAAVNAPALSVASGPKPALMELERRLAEKEIGCRRIRIDVAAHSSMLEGILRPFGDYLRSVSLHPPRIPFISNRTGTWITTEQATDPEYWVGHLRNTVRFADGVSTLLQTGEYALLEVGPGRTLTSLARLHPDWNVSHGLITSLRTADDQTPDPAHMLGAMGRLWQSGVEIDWETFHGPGRRRVSLPTYAFDHARYWIEPGTSVLDASTGDAAQRSTDVEQWFHQPVWQRTATPAAPPFEGSRVLVLGARDPFTDVVISELKARGADTRVVGMGAKLSLDWPDRLALRPGSADDFVHLADALTQNGFLPTHVLHLYALDLKPGASLDAAERALAFDSLFHLAQVAGNEDWKDLRWLVVTRRRVEVAGEPIRTPLAALAMGPARVLPREFPSWRWTVVDLDDQEGRADAAGRVLAEFGDDSGEAVIALRGSARFVETFLPAASPARTAPAVQPGGTYLITGGTGGLGLVAARAIAGSAPVTLVLLARRALPEREYWAELIESSSSEAGILLQIRKLEELGSNVVLETGDVTSLEDMRRLASRIRARSGPVRGIIHTAGVIEDSPLLTKDPASALRVLAPKVAGPLVIDEAFAGEALDFVVLYSSTSSFLGLPGQIDYTAANAFLDCFAHYRSARGANWISIAWPAWRETGMAAAAAAGTAGGRLPAGRPVDHPLLDRRVEDGESRATWATLFDVPGHWVLNEHHIKDGPALIPGSGFIELARAAFSERQGNDGPVSIREAAFELPFIVGEEERKVLNVSLQDEGSATRFSISGETLGDTVEHARGLVSAAPVLDGTLDLDSIRARCTRGEQRFDDPDHHPFMNFGPRWQALRTVHYGEREALVELEIPPAFEGDLEHFGLHPALLDMATAGAQRVIDNYSPSEELYVPIGYGEIVFNGRFPKRSFSHVVFRPAEGSQFSHEIASLDVTVSDERGRIFLEVRDFVLRRITGAGAFGQMIPLRRDAVSPILQRTLELGIDPAEGEKALMFVLGHRTSPHIVASPYAPAYLRRELLQRAVAEPPAPKRTHDADADADIPAVERALAGCPSVSAVVVRSFLDATEERRLVGYFVPNLEHYVTVGEIRRFARTALAPDLVPQQFVELDELPRTPGGEVDRRQLGDPLAPRDTYVQPRTTTEKIIARIWEDALGVERVGLSDNFFDLGGYSLLATRVILQTEKKLGIRLDHASMVLNTLEQTAREIDRRNEARTHEAQASAATVPDSKQGRRFFQSLFSGK
jgi:acyl transferase domain-containing protein